jgi:hypothetical protein
MLKRKQISQRIIYDGLRIICITTYSDGTYKRTTSNRTQAIPQVLNYKELTRTCNK